MALLPCSQCAFRPRSVEKLAYPRLVRLHELVQRADGDFPVGQNGDTAADREQRREVMGDDDDGNSQALVQPADQRVDAAGGERIEIRGRLVEKQDAWIERQRPRKCGALDHAAGQLGRKLYRAVGRHAGKLELHRSDSFLLFGREIGMLAHRQHDVLRHRKRGKQRALLKQHADERSLLRGTDLVDCLAVDENLAAIWPMQAGERLEQDRFARPRAAGDAEDFPAQDIETDLVVHFLAAEPVDDVPRRQNGLGMRLGVGAHRPSFSKRMENNASSTITTKIALTTARVVSRPTLSAEPLTLSPCMQPMMAIRKPKTGALTRPTKRSLPSTAWCTRSMYCSGDTCSSELEIIAPPSKPMMSEKNVSSGSVMTSPINRGTTSNSMGSMPITLSASISSRAFMTPISAVNAEPERPATMIAVISTPISRSMETATRLMVKSSPP